MNNRSCKNCYYYSPGGLIKNIGICVINNKEKKDQDYCEYFTTKKVDKND